MNSFNQVTLIGNLASDPELKSTKTGKKVTQFPIAIHRSTKRDGEWGEATDYHRVISWGPQAEAVSKYLKKGKKVFVSGRLVTRSYEDNQGQTRYVTEIVAHHVEFMSLPSKKVGNGQKENHDESESAPEEAELPDVQPADFAHV